MIGSFLLGAAILAVGVGLLAKFWDSITLWLQRAAKAVKNAISGVVYGCTVFVRKLREGLKEISKHYSKKGTKWEETTVTRQISESEVPEEIRNRASYSQDTDITDECNEQMELRVS